jgi:hypothetical protein
LVPDRQNSADFDEVDVQRVILPTHLPTPPMIFPRVLCNTVRGVVARVRKHVGNMRVRVGIRVCVRNCGRNGRRRGFLVEVTHWGEVVVEMVRTSKN